GLNADYASAFSGGVATITLSSALPTVTDPLILDAQRQPGWSAAPIVELNGNNAGTGTSGLVLSAGGSAVRGFVINRFKLHGIAVSGGGASTIAGNRIGLKANGASASANGRDGIYVGSSADNVIGGTAPADRNIVS